MSSRGNAYRDDVRVILLGGWQVTGPGSPLKFVALDGLEVEEDWNVQKGTGTSGATTVWRGTKPAEAVVVTVEAPDEESFDSLSDLLDRMSSTVPNGKPPSLPVENVLINFLKITRVCKKKVKGPYESKGLSWRMDITFIQYFPSAPAKTGPQDPSKSTDPTATTPASAAEKRFNELAKEAGLL